MSLTATETDESIQSSLQLQSSEDNNEDICRIVLIGSDYVHNEKLIELIFVDSSDQVIDKTQIYRNIHKYSIIEDSQVVNVYSVTYNDVNERKFFDIFNKFLSIDLQNRIDNFIYFDKLDKFMTQIENDVFKILSKYFCLKFDSVILSTDEHILKQDKLLEQLICAKKDQLKNCQEPDVFYDCVELGEGDNLNADSSRINRIFDNITEKRRHNIFLNSSIDKIYMENGWMNVIDLDFGIDFELELYECALLCDCTKKNKNSMKQIESRNWQYLSEYEERGYLAITYYKKVQGKTVIVMSHRGTKLNKITNLFYDFEIALQIEPDILKKALRYENEVLENFELKSNSIILVHIGFSLGGYLAANCATRNLNRTFVTKYSITFDAPGIIFEGNKNIKNENNLVNYFVVPNLVNTCNKHAGKIYQMTSNLAPIEEYTKICFKTVLSLPKEILYLTKSHDLDFIVGLTKNYNILRLVKKWPVAVNKIYAQKISHKRHNTIIYE